MVRCFICFYEYTLLIIIIFFFSSSPSNNPSAATNRPPSDAIQSLQHYSSPPLQTYSKRSSRRERTRGRVLKRRKQISSSSGVRPLQSRINLMIFQFFLPIISLPIICEVPSSPHEIIDLRWDRGSRVSSASRTMKGDKSGKSSFGRAKRATHNLIISISLALR